MTIREQPIYAFEGFHLDAQRRVLSRPGGEPIPLAPKVFDTLLRFVEHQGELLTSARCSKRFGRTLSSRRTTSTRVFRR